MRTALCFGPHGCGKSTLVLNLIADGWTPVIMHYVLKQYIGEHDDPVAKEIKMAMRNREYLADEFTIPLFRDYMLKKYPPGSHRFANAKLVIDGFPRTPAQAEATLDLFCRDKEGYGFRPQQLCLCEIKITPEETIRRERARGRTDFNEEQAVRGFQLYEQKTLPALKLIAKHTQLVHELDSSLPPAMLAQHFLSSASANSLAAGV